MSPTHPSKLRNRPQLYPRTFAWTEYEQLMISEAIHRGEVVYNIALRIDPNSLMRAAAFQLIRNVLHGCGTVIALRPEDNFAAATVEIVEAAIGQPATGRTHRATLPHSDASSPTLRIERAANALNARARTSRRHSGGPGRASCRQPRRER